MRPDWPHYAMALAEAAAIRSEDPYYAVGCAVLRQDRTVAAVGYNGAPPGVELDWTDRDGRRPFVIHAEQNALRYCKPGEIELLATTMHPCAECVKLAAAYGINHIVWRVELDLEVYDTAATRRMAATCGIILERI